MKHAENYSVYSSRLHKAKDFEGTGVGLPFRNAL